MSKNKARFVLCEAKFTGKCKECSTRINEGENIVYDTQERKAYCVDCGNDLLEEHINAR